MLQCSILVCNAKKCLSFLHSLIHCNHEESMRELKICISIPSMIVTTSKLPAFHSDAADTAADKKTTNRSCIQWSEIAPSPSMNQKSIELHLHPH
mmetsp:Transcript_10742/g.22794  ORF Transcript_10742/g.22794 Transcript_10742/m.22794 type:complete len:95 (-) Transcript_10742:36-320(-)